MFTRRGFLATSTVLAVDPPAVRWPPVLPRKIRVGIIGLEGHYSEITAAAKQAPQITVTAVAEPDALYQKKLTLDTNLKDAKLYDDYRRLLDGETLDVVAVCGPNQTRSAIVRACAERKLPIVAEKPLAITAEELASTRRVVNAAHVPLTMLLPMRFDPVFQAMKGLVTEGVLGEIVSISAQKSYKLGKRGDWVKARASYGGTIPFIGIHMIDLMRWLSGRELVEVAAFHANVGAAEVGTMENTTALIFRLDNNGTATLNMDYARPGAAPTHGDDRFRMAGTKGVAEYQEGRGLTVVTAAEPPREIKDLPPAHLLFLDFLDALYNRKQHLIRPEEIYRVNDICLKARDAADKKRVNSLRPA